MRLFAMLLRNKTERYTSRSVQKFWVMCMERPELSFLCVRQALSVSFADSSPKGRAKEIAQTIRQRVLFREMLCDEEMSIPQSALLPSALYAQVRHRCAAPVHK